VKGGGGEGKTGRKPLMLTKGRVRSPGTKVRGRLTQGGGKLGHLLGGEKNFTTGRPLQSQRITRKKKEGRGMRGGIVKVKEKRKKSLPQKISRNVNKRWWQGGGKKDHERWGRKTLELLRNWKKKSFFLEDRFSLVHRHRGTPKRDTIVFAFVGRGLDEGETLWPKMQGDKGNVEEKRNGARRCQGEKRQLDPAKKGKSIGRENALSSDISRGESLFVSPGKGESSLEGQTVPLGGEGKKR